MNLKELFEKQDKEFEEKFDKPLSDEAVRLYNLPNKNAVYFDNTEIKQFISKIRQETLEAVREEIKSKLKTVSMIPSERPPREEMLKMAEYNKPFNDLLQAITEEDANSFNRN